MKNIWIRSKAEEATPIEKALRQALTQAGFHLAQSASENIDLCLSVGGDGTFLAAVRELGLKRFEVPVLGVHGSKGRGFLLPLIPPLEAGQLLAWARSVAEALNNKDYGFEERWGLTGRILGPDGSVINDKLWAFNDVVVTKSALSRMVWLRILVDGRELLSRFRGDGFIVSSASGSTAYSLSAGGPIMHPSLKNIVITPVCPQTLAHRSVVLGDKSCVSIEVLENTTPSYLTDDGQSGREIAIGSRVELARAAQPVRMLVPKRLAPLYEEYFQILREKLGFGGN